MNIEAQYLTWKDNPYFDADTRKELAAIDDNDDEIYDRFYRDLEFGTAGIRGLIGAGTNRINIYVVRRVSAAIAGMILARNAAKKGVVIGYDTRNFSLTFAKEAAAVFAGNGIKVYFHDKLAPVPVLSYSIRALKCEFGIMITASHNPKEYNGYKVYGSDGAQIPPEDSKIVTENIEKLADFTKVPKFSYDFFRDHGKIVEVKQSVYDGYLSSINKLTVDKKLIAENADKLNIVYTPLHGTGAVWVPDVLDKLGYKNVSVVPEQMIADGNFPTVPVPNPEVRGAYDLAVKLAEEKGAGMIIATDPDADRMGCFVKDANGEFIMLNGNQIGCLLLDYILSSKKKLGTLPKNGFVVSTIVSSNLAAAICKAYDINFTQVLTGFKFIGEQIVKREENGNEKFLFGFEESYGYLAGSYARDKDGVAAAVLMTEVACYYNSKGMSVIDALEEIYKKYGYFVDMQVSLELKGELGVSKMKNLMEKLRELKDNLFDIAVFEFQDIKNGTCLDTATMEVSKIDLPSSNVLKYILEDGWVTVRPSGTEPKIKFYFGFESDKSMETARKEADSVRDTLMKKIKALIAEV